MNEALWDSPKLAEYPNAAYPEPEMTFAQVRKDMIVFASNRNGKVAREKNVFVADWKK